MRIYAEKPNLAYTVQSGRTYNITTAGRWKDFMIECDEFGWNGTRFGWLAWVYNNRWVDAFKVVPGFNFMRLIGRCRRRILRFGGEIRNHVQALRGPHRVCERRTAILFQQLGIPRLRTTHP